MADTFGRATRNIYSKRRDERLVYARLEVGDRVGGVEVDETKHRVTPQKR